MGRPACDRLDFQHSPEQQQGWYSQLSACSVSTQAPQSLFLILVILLGLFQIIIIVIIRTLGVGLGLVF